MVAGQFDLAVVLGAEKMCVPEFGLINSGQTELDTQLGLVAPASFAMRAVRHMIDFGTTPEHLAHVSVKNRRHAQHNSIAQFRQPVTLQEVLAAPMIVVERASALFTVFGMIGRVLYFHEFVQWYNWLGSNIFVIGRSPVTLQKRDPAAPINQGGGASASGAFTHAPEAFRNHKITDSMV